MNALETHVLELIGESTDSPDVFTDDDEGLEPIRESLNDAIEEIVLVTGSYTEKYQILLVEDQSFYRLKLNRGDVAWITDAWLVGQKRRLVQKDVYTLNVMNPRWLQVPGTPHYYIPVGHNIVGTYPTYGGSDEVIQLTMVVSPSRLTTSTDRIKLRDSFQWAAVDYAVGQFYASRGDAKEAMNWHNKYLNALGVFGTFPKSRERDFHNRAT
jgi:hypothetical protein